MSSAAAPHFREQTAAHPEQQSALEISNVGKMYGSVRALAGVNLTVKRGEILTLLGPSGSGKTTLLKTIAGFEDLDSGRIILEGDDLARIPTSRRDIGMVFQSYALFPHLTVAENVAFPLKMRSYSRSQLVERVNSFLKMVDLGGFGERYPSQLSGGQQQRVALARATVFGPRLLLLDEPFGALDRKLRESIQLQVRELQRKLRLTTIFITHDQEEALVMSDRIAVMRDGTFQQVGTPDEIYRMPTNEFVADFVGESNLLRGRLEVGPNNLSTINVADGLRIRVRALGRRAGEEVSVLVRPEALHPVAENLEPDNVVSGQISEVIYLGNSIKYRFDADNGVSLIVRRQRAANEDILARGTRIDFGWSSADGHVLT
ncbi:ABC transporter ATP-binding protein [Microvirga sp. M2]|uniref:ABC transporter ATP-binding protein n=1 Tax=Microvirga sp. M2 TaxID=3073270 RepID=UPI0039C1CFE5